MMTQSLTRSVTRVVGSAVAIAIVVSLASSADAALRHWYKFDEGSGTTATDSAGGANGTLSGNAALTAGGLELNLVAGVPRDGVVSLDTDGDSGNGSGLNIAGYSALTVDLWATSDANLNNSFSTAVGFGKVNTTNAALAAEYFLLQTNRGDNVSRAALSFSDDGSPWDEEEGANGSEANDNLLHHYRAIVTAADISLYVDGTLAQTTPLVNNALANISDEFALIGVAYAADQNWAGTVRELRIYDHAVPEPASLALLGLAGLATLLRRRHS